MGATGATDQTVAFSLTPVEAAAQADVVPSDGLMAELARRLGLRIVGLLLGPGTADPCR